MSPENNKAVFRRFIEEVLQRGNLDAVDELMSPEFVEHEPLPPGLPMTREGAKQFLGMLRGAFSEMEAIVEDEISQGDRVVARLTISGKHTGELAGVAPTGRIVSFGVVDICRLEDGRIVEHWGIADQLGMLQQIGAIDSAAH